MSTIRKEPNRVSPDDDSDDGESTSIFYQDKFGLELAPIRTESS